MNLAAGEPLPVLRLTIARVDLIRYCGAANDLVPLHWDQDGARAAGFPDVVVNGWLGCAQLCRAATLVFTPDRWRLAHFAVRYRRPVFPGDVQCGGMVLSMDAGAAAVEAWLRDAQGDVATTGRLEFRALCDPSRL